MAKLNIKSSHLHLTNIYQYNFENFTSQSLLNKALIFTIDKLRQNKIV